MASLSAVLSEPSMAAMKGLQEIVAPTLIKGVTLGGDSKHSKKTPCKEFAHIGKCSVGVSCRFSHPSRFSATDHALPRHKNSDKNDDIGTLNQYFWIFHLCDSFNCENGEVCLLLEMILAELQRYFSLYQSSMSDDGGLHLYTTMELVVNLILPRIRSIVGFQRDQLQKIGASFPINLNTTARVPFVLQYTAFLWEQEYVPSRLQLIDKITKDCLQIKAEWLRYETLYHQSLCNDCSSISIPIDKAIIDYCSSVTRSNVVSIMYIRM